MKISSFFSFGKVDGREYLFTDRDLYKLFLPLSIEQFLAYLVGLVNSVMVSSVSEAAVAGVSLVDFVMMLLFGVFSALSTGGAVIAGQYLGRKQMKESSEAANQLVWFAGIAAVIVMALIYLLKPFILHVLFDQITEEVRTQASIYLTIVAASIPFLALYNATAAIFRTMGNSKLPMKVMFSMNILHMIGNGVLLYRFHMGTAGVAIPTLVSRVLAAVIIVVMLSDKRQIIHIKRRVKHRFNVVVIRRILHIGIPYGLENGLFYFSHIVVLSLVASFGTASIAANSVAGKIAFFTTLPGIAINHGMTTVISRCIGRGDYEQAKYYHRKIIGIVYVFHLVINILIIALLPLILTMYTLSETTVALTSRIVIWHAILAVIVWPLAYTQPVTFRAAGDAKFPMVTGIMTMFLCRIVMAYVLGGYFGMGVFGTFAAMFLDWIVKAVVFTYRYIRGGWMRFNAI